MQRVPTYRPTLEEALGGKPTKAEAKLLAAAKAGKEAELRPDGLRPEKSTAATRIRAGLIRFLMLGGDDQHPVHPRGVLLRSAWITGKLDLEACETQLDLKLWACHFEAAPDFDDAHLGGLYLPGCHVPGLRGQRLWLEDDLQLCALALPDGSPLPFTATGPVDIAGARIAGNLDCAGGRFDGAGGIALDSDALTVGASVFLRDGFHATGEVNLTGATITGQLDCTGGRFDGAGGRALNGDALTVGADVFLRDGFHATGVVNLIRATITGTLQVSAARIEGLFDLIEARVGVLVDDAATWAEATKVRLSGFTYSSVHSAMSPTHRMALFQRANATGRFDPGPYTRHAGVLRRTGHRVDASQFLFQREHLLRKAERVEARQRGGWGHFGAALMWIRDTLFRGLIGYAYRPVNALVCSALILTCASFFFADVYKVGQFAPNSDVILNSQHWLAAVEKSDALKADGYNVPAQHLWTGQNGVSPPMPPSIDYETFHPVLYAVDLFLPLDTIGQTEAWAPSKDRGGWGWVGYYARMPIQLLGWLITALVAALFAGLIGKRDD